MSTQFDQVKLLEQCQISPPPNSIPTTSFPLNFLDIAFIVCSPIQRVFLYQVPFSAAQFLEEVLPQLKDSLSLALQRFFPFCGNFVCPPEPSEPYILYNDGDSIPLLVAQSSGAFSDFLRYGPKDAREIHALVPPTPTARVLYDTLVEITPLLAVQVTLFPNTGLSIGVTYRHMVADGASAIHFIKTWATIFKAKCELSSVSMSLPVHDRGAIKDPNGLNDHFLQQWRAWGSPTWKEPATLMEDNVRATFTLSRIEIERIQKWISTKYDYGTGRMLKLHFSSFVATTAFVWVCLIKSLDMITADSLSKDKEMCHFCIIADCRNKYDLGIPATYFGNCISGNFVSVTRSEFKQEDCIATVAAAISRCVQGFKEESLDGYKNAFSKWGEVVARGENMLTVAGSPKLAEYEIDFGWGKPEKIKLVHIDVSGSISLSESRNEKGGIEIGICRSKNEMEVFTSFFQEGLTQFV